ncbi:head maturation protease, ClpP-related [Cytobacillus firmus]|uniref:head maturation protease, ClpP-related n=1 Tax=Cytobacillus firmus TaxID=1399 RepID=UPI0018CCE083|nr:head maturation protease, ClpP-related [Cytobacillus firmus]MED1942129.1 Clp protease ClpP [Cytobacillus firmus]
MKIEIKGPIISDRDQWIYDWFGIKATSPSKVHEQLSKVPENEEIEMDINSGGGSVFDASEIYTALRNHPSKVKGDIVGLAASAASVIAMAADHLRMSPTSQMMIHNASSIAIGDHREMSHTSDFLKNVNQTIANAYRLKSGKDDSELLKMMDAETWMTPQQAKEHGLIDEIMFETEASAVASVQSGMIPPEVLDKLRNELKNVSPESSISSAPAVMNIAQNKREEGKEMNLEQLKNDYPELYKQVKNEGYQEGVKAENQRIKDIEDLQLPGNDALINQAKFETNASASDVAVQIIKAEKERGQNFLNDRNKDADPLNNAGGVHTPLTPANDGEKEKHLISNTIGKMFGGVKNELGQ